MGLIPVRKKMLEGNPKTKIKTVGAPLCALPASRRHTHTHILTECARIEQFVWERDRACRVIPVYELISFATWRRKWAICQAGQYPGRSMGVRGRGEAAM